jgi:hypothetical protein
VPWQIRLTARFVEQAPPGYLLMLEAVLKLGVPSNRVAE